jgi:hypothetical protein
VVTKRVNVQFFLAVPMDPEVEWPAGFPREAVIAALQNLEGEQAEIPYRGGGALFAQVLRAGSDQPAHVAFWTLRDDEPDVHHEGTIQRLDLGDDRLAEPTHACFFGAGVMGMLGGRGPRASAIAHYLRAKAEVPVAWEVILRRDVAERLRREEEMKMFDIKVLTGHVDDVAGSLSSFGRQLVGLADYVPEGSLEVVLKSAPRVRPREQMTNRVKPLLNQLLRADVLENLEKLRVSTRNRAQGGEEIYDLLQDRVTVSRSVQMRADRRHIDEDAAFEAIRSAYDIAYDEIRAALEA